MSAVHALHDLPVDASRIDAKLSPQFNPSLQAREE